MGAGVVIETDAETGDRGSVTMLYTSPVVDVDPVDEVAADVVTKIVSTRLDEVIPEVPRRWPKPPKKAAAAE